MNKPDFTMAGDEQKEVVKVPIKLNGPEILIFYAFVLGSIAGLLAKYLF